MPDVSRSDSQRSDTSNRPRVSFNRDVHVKRIVTHDSAPVTGALSGDGAGHLVALPVRKERLGGLTKKQLAEEASKVLNQADKIDCTTNKGKPPDKFYTLPTRKKHKQSESPHSSQERLTTRRRSEELEVPPAPPKPPRTFTTSTPKKNSNKGTKQKNSLLRLFAKSENNNKSNEPKKSNLKRSVSDASNLKSNSKIEQKSNRKRSGSESEDNPNNSSTKKTQLSPIIEVSTPKDDYFSVKKDYFSNKENVDDFIQEKNDINVNKKPPRKKWDKSPSNKSKGLQEKHDNRDAPEIVFIDVEKAESINDNKKKKLSSNSFKNTFKFLLNKDKIKQEQDSKKAKKAIIKEEEAIDEVDNSKLSSLTIEPPPLHLPESKTSPKIQEAIKILEGSLDKSLDMIHSSQLPAQKIPLTRGHTVDTMIKRLSRDKYSPPPKTNTILVTPTVTVAHNNNQPFSYTQPRGLSPERPYSRSKSPERPYSRSKSPERPYSRSKSPDRPYTRSKSPLFDKPSSPVIYAQVVCSNGETDGLGSNKKTVHTAYSTNKNKFQHSDSDEGLGYEENHGFSRKYTQFGDEKKFDIDKFDEEYPITPKFKSFGSSNNGYDNYEYSKTEHHASYIDSSARGRGDGMDSRRRESLTEPLIENGINVKFNDNFHNGKSDLSHRRDLLESRINSRRLADKFANHSPELYTPRVNKYVAESTSKYYRHGSSSPVGFTENYRSETKIDRNGEKYVTESKSRTVQGDQIEQNNYHNRYDRYDQEPKSVDSLISDYRSSPENATRKYYASHEASKDYRSLHSNKYKAKGDKLSKDRDHYKSNPEIINRNYDPSYMYDNSETYHDSLRRQKYDIRKDDIKQSDKYFDNGERIDKFGDSGIENDFRRDSGENVRMASRTYTQTYRSNNESEDEGFASSLLIASERQHTEDNFINRKFRKEYDSDKEIRRNGEISKTKHEYVHRERSIDDGSHYDPRIDKDLDEKRGSLKMDTKPPKPAKMSSLKKVKQLFTRDSNKKVKKDKMEPPRLATEESLRARYKVYTGNREGTLKKETGDYRRDYNSDSKIDNNSENSQTYDYSNRRRLSTPNSSPRQIRESANQVQSGKQQDSWFKSLDRFSLKKNKSLKNDVKEKPKVDSPKATPAKNLRFFGDTDLDSDTSVRRKSSLKSRPNIPNNYKSPAAPKTRSQSTRNLHNISEEFNHPDVETRYKSHKSMQNICESDRETRGSKSNLKPPISPTRKMETLKTKTDSRNRKRRNDISSVESSTEGDSSQQSQKSVVYLHAATVGDIPGPGYLARNGRRAASKEDLISNGSSRMQPQVKTLSRSFSVLAPWKPRYAHEGLDIDYSPQARPVRHLRNGSSKSGGKTAKEISNQKKMSNQNLSTLNRKSKSKENVSNSTLNRRTKDEVSSRSSNNTTTLYKKKERSPKENTRYSRDDKKIASKSMSVESLGGGSRSSLRSKEDSRNISRSISMPRDPEKSAGWFNKINKKNSKKNLSSSQRL